MLLPIVVVVNGEGGREDGADCTLSNIIQISRDGANDIWTREGGEEADKGE